MRNWVEIGHDEYSFGNDPTTISNSNIISRHNKTQTSSSIEQTRINTGLSIHFYKIESFGKVNEVNLKSTATSE